MSTFEVKFRKIEKVEKHPNADALDLAVIGGYNAVIKRGEFKINDMALYIPTDSLFTDLEIAVLLKVDSYLTGKGKNRVKAVKLRGVLSEGIVIPYEIVMTALIVKQIADPIDLNVDLSTLLHIEKYEEPIPVHMAGKVRHWPSFLSKYDVENIKRPESFESMREDEEVVFTEKLHGTNMSVAISVDAEEDDCTDDYYVCSRKTSLKREEGNLYWDVCIANQLGIKIKDIKAMLNARYVGLYGEVVGIQDLKYGCINGQHDFYAFDIAIDGNWLNYDEFKKICKEVDIKVVPELYRGNFNYKLALELASGITVVPNAIHIREGLVVKPVIERVNVYGDRVNFKLLSEEYLTRKGGTELH